MNNLNYRGPVSLEVFNQAQKLHLGYRWLGLLLFPVAMGGMLLFGVIGTNPSLTAKLFGVGITFIWPVMMYRLMRRQWVKIFNGSPYLKEAFVGSLSEEGLHFESQYGSVKVPWRMFTKVRKRTDLVLLYQSPIMFQIVSRGFFDTQETWESAVTFIDQHLAKAAQPAAGAGR